MRGKARAAVVSCLVALAAYAGFLSWRDRNRGAVQRGYAVAGANGCFTCHGPGGLRGMPNPGYGLDDVPSWSGGLVTMYAQNQGEIREWILDGLPRRVRDDPEQRKLRDAALIRMPAFRGRLSEAELSDLVALVAAVSDLETPKDDKPAEGRRVAEAFGCFNCHGPQGRGTPSNPGSFKGYIPAWDGDDFPDLARDDAEIRQWIRDGGVARLNANPLARFFLRRQKIRMPAYAGHIKDEEVERLLDYVHWLRRGR